MIFLGLVMTDSLEKKLYSLLDPPSKRIEACKYLNTSEYELKSSQNPPLPCFKYYKKLSGIIENEIKMYC